MMSVFRFPGVYGRCALSLRRPSPARASLGLAMTISYIPQELIDLILEYLHNDKRALAVCSLVRRSWIPSSSRELFRELSLRLPDPDSCQSSSHWSESFLVTLLGSERVRSRVHVLTFRSDSANGRAQCSLAVLQYILSVLPRLEKFKIQDVNISAHVPSKLVCGLPPVEAPLQLQVVDVCNILDFSTYRGVVAEVEGVESTGLAEFLNIFSTIGELQIDNGALPPMNPIVWHLLEANPIPLPRQIPLHVETLTLAGSQATRMLNVLYSMTDRTTLRELTVELSPRMIAPINHFLAMMQNLEVVNFTLRHDITSFARTFYRKVRFPDNF